MLSPRTVRLDLKCGKGSISPGEKCHKGAATKTTKRGKKEASFATKAAVVGGAALALGGGLYAAKKFRKAQSIPVEFEARREGGKRPTPEETASAGREVFKQTRKTISGTQIAGAGVALAGAGLMAYGKEKKNTAATMAGAGVAYIGAATALGGFSSKSKLKEMEGEFNVQQEAYRRQYYQAQEAAKQRQKAAGSSYGSRRTTPNAAIKDPFKDLGVSENASDAEIKRAWLKLIRANHPDAGGDPELAKKYNAAYQEILLRRGKLDSIWADGFHIDWEALAL